ncbi:MAG: VOC family protein [Thermoleophilia bacterium]|nr:VOC family protein [Thermoleophilia bacterium]
MLSTAPISAILPALDLERAKKFYGESLGLRTAPESRDLKEEVVFEAGDGTRVLLYHRDTIQSDHTEAGFWVQDLVKEMDELRKKGVDFEEYDIPEMHLKTEEGIAAEGPVRTAWFKDSEGNILALNEYHAS